MATAAAGRETCAVLIAPMTDVLLLLLLYYVAACTYSTHTPDKPALFFHNFCFFPLYLIHCVNYDVALFSLRCHCLYG
jgi:hypothetical protein